MGEVREQKMRRQLGRWTDGQVTDEAGGKVVGGKEGKKMGAGCVETGIESTIGGTAERDGRGDVGRRGTETDDCTEKDGQEDRAEAWARWWQ